MILPTIHFEHSSWSVKICFSSPLAEGYGPWMQKYILLQTLLFLVRSPPSFLLPISSARIAGGFREQYSQVATNSLVSRRTVFQ